MLSSLKEPAFYRGIYDDDLIMYISIPPYHTTDLLSWYDDTCDGAFEVLRWGDMHSHRDLLLRVHQIYPASLTKSSSKFQLMIVLWGSLMLAFCWVYLP